MHLNYRYLYVLILKIVICNKDLTCHALKFEARNEANIEFEPGRLSYCLLNERHNKERWVDCLYSKEPVIEMPTSFLHDFDLCLRKIEYKSLLDSHMLDEQIVISYHGCLASAELQQMASMKILQADYNSVTLEKKGLKYPLLINSICFIIVLTVILYLVETVDWKLALERYWKFCRCSKKHSERRSSKTEVRGGQGEERNADTTPEISKRGKERLRTRQTRKFRGFTNDQLFA